MTTQPVMKKQKPFSKESLLLDVEHEVNRIVDQLREDVEIKLHRHGAVVGISGGIDSSVVLALCIRAFGPEKVVGILLPEKESSPESIDLAYLLAKQFGIETCLEDISGALEGAGCYRRRDEALTRVFPEYQSGWSAKIVLPGNLLEQGTLNIFRAVVTSPDGVQYEKRLPPAEFRQIVAASNFKQRMRMSMLYYHAELRNYAMIGTPNKNEHDLGFFVKHGDGGMDVSPIGHLFKTQVYQLAHYLGIPHVICQRTPTTDTYPGGSSQEEFFYRIPFEILDTVWYGYEQGVSHEEIARALDLQLEQVERIITDINTKKHTTEYLRTPVLVIE